MILLIGSGLQYQSPHLVVSDIEEHKPLLIRNQRIHDIGTLHFHLQIAPLSTPQFDSVLECPLSTFPSQWHPRARTMLQFQVLNRPSTQWRKGIITIFFVIHSSTIGVQPIQSEDLVFRKPNKAKPRSHVKQTSESN